MNNKTPCADAFANMNTTPPTKRTTPTEPSPLYASSCCKNLVTWEGEPEWPDAEVATMNARCTVCGQPCTPIDVGAALEEVEKKGGAS